MLSTLLLGVDKMAKYYYSPIKQKIVLLLLAGVTLCLNRSPRTHLRIIKNIPRAWKNIDRSVLYRTLHEFHNERLVDFNQQSDGSTIITLTEKGEKFALRFKIDEISIPIPVHWDKKWRIVIFDIPEKHKGAREALRIKLSELGFIQFQKSV